MDRMMRGSGVPEVPFRDPAVTLPPRQLAALATYARVGDRRQAAFVLGISLPTFNEHLTRAFRALDVTSAMSAFWALGWLHVPEAA